ncbi:MAG TPA: DUF2520 domain-containing protein [Acidimicrobiales bacterium]|nr:DUF2520 domain-containing protein [Acidimicrobiales bacterium]
MSTALVRAGWSSLGSLARGQSVAGAAHGTDYVIVAVRDSDIAAVAAAIEADPTAVLVHLAGSAGTEILGAHERRAAIHPLVSLTQERGADVLLSGVWFGFEADPAATEAAARLVTALGGRSLPVPADRRALYHATATIASNHLVALLGQVDRLASELGLPPDAFIALARGSLENAAALGATGALTGPVSRGDWDTLDRHRRALPADERDLYEALAAAAARLAGRELPPP